PTLISGSAQTETIDEHRLRPAGPGRSGVNRVSLVILPVRVMPVRTADTVPDAVPEAVPA
ncbi:MAG: hypothetical protein WB580_23540, partial [Candidatus Binataceae bacterium]